MSHWGYHLTLDCHDCHRALIKERLNVQNFIKELVNRIDMQPIGEPWIEYTAADIPDKAGFTAVQIIVTSSIVAHFIDSTGDIYLDVFSCKEFRISTVREVVQEYFKPLNMRMNFLTRQAG
jgi:S-adenosylmethionine/arginine decarboxylase-like enzyme